MQNGRDFIRELSRLNQFKSISFILLEWLIIASCIISFLSFKPYSYFFLPLYVFILGTRMYAFYSLLHDGLHFLILKNKKLNDWVSRVFLAWPIFISLKEMRKNHYSHHKNFYTDEDPEYQLKKYTEFHFPLKRQKLVKILLADLSGFNFIKYKIYAFRKNKKEVFIWIGIVSVLLVLFSLKLYTVLEVLFLLWLVPYMTVFQTLNRLRAYTEHFNLPENIKTRSLIIHPALSFFFTPHALGYHEVHHLYPYIPQYNLKQLHQYLSNSSNEMYIENSLSQLIKKIYA